MQSFEATNERVRESDDARGMADQTAVGCLEGRWTFRRSSQGAATAYRLIETRDDRDCFFHAVNRPELSRDSLVERLYAHARDEEVRRSFASEICQFLYLGATRKHEDPAEHEAYDKLVTEEFLALSRRSVQLEGKVQELVVTARNELGEEATKDRGPAALVVLLRGRNASPAQALCEAHQAVLGADRQMIEYCSQEAIFSGYVRFYLMEARGFIPLVRRLGGEGERTLIDVVNELFQTNIQVFLADGTRITVKQPEPSIPIFHNGIDHFSGLELLSVADASRERSLDHILRADSWEEILNSDATITSGDVLEGLCGAIQEEQLRLESISSPTSASLCKYGYFLLVQSRDQEASLLLKKAVQQKEDGASITYEPTKLNALKEPGSFDSESSTIAINASCLASFLLSRFFLQRGEFQKSWDWALTAEESTGQRPLVVQTFLLKALKKELAQAASTVIMERSRAICGFLKSVPKLSFSFKNELDEITASDKEIFRLLGEELAPDEELLERARVLLSQQSNRLRLLGSALDEGVQKELLSALTSLRLLKELLLEAFGMEAESVDFVTKLLQVAAYSAGEQALLSSELETAKGFFAYLMTQVHRCDPRIVGKSALHLGQLYLEKNTKDDCVKAAGLFNYAYRLSSTPAKKNEPSSAEAQSQYAFATDQCLEKIALAHAQMIKLCSQGLLSIPAHELTSCDVANRACLDKIRKSIETQIPRSGAKAEETKALFDEIAERMKGFAVRIFQQCAGICGQPQCEFAMITLGSLARHEATPWSDLEFAFLIEEGKDDPMVIQHFTDLTYLMHLRVINLGETILPALNICELKLGEFYDDVTPRGFAFDGGGVAGKGHKTPLGQKERVVGERCVAHEFRLIQTPAQMAQFQGKSQKYEGAYWFELEPHLPLELINVDFAHGNSELVRSYQDALQTILSTLYGERPLREHLAFNLLVEEDLVHFNPWSHVQPLNAGRLLRAKNDLYRLPHLALDRFAILSSISQSSSWEKIEALQKNHTLGSEGAKRLEWLLGETMRFRLIAYAEAGCQREELNPLLNPFVNDDATQTSHYFDLKPASLNVLTIIYQTLLPLYNALEQVVRRRSLGALPGQNFLDESEESLGQIAMRLQQYERAKHYLERAPNSATTWLLLGQIAQAEACFEEAKRCYLALKDWLQQQPNQPSFDIEINKISAVGALAALYREIGNLVEAKKVLDEYCRAPEPFCLDELSALNRAQWQEVKHKISSVLGLLAIESGLFDKAENIFENLLPLLKDPEKAGVLVNLGAAFSYHDSDKSRRLYEKALSLYRNIYPSGHLSQAILLHNLAHNLEKTGAFQEARERYLQGLKIVDHLGCAHPLRVSLLVGLSTVDTFSARFEQAEDKLNEALNIALKTVPDDVGLFCRLYGTLGDNYFRWGKSDEAGECFALLVGALPEREHGIVDEQLVEALCASTQVLADLGKFDSANKCSQQALQLLGPLDSARPKLAIQALQVRANCLLDLGKIDEAILLYEQSYEIFSSRLGNARTNSFSIRVLSGISRAFVQIGRATEAIQILEPLSRGSTQSPDDSMEIWSSLGLAYGARGDAAEQPDDHRKALDCHQKVLNICQTFLGPCHPRIIPYLRNKAGCLVDLGRLGEAEDCISKAYELISCGKGATLPDRYCITSQFAQILRLKEDLPRETIYLLRLLELAKELFGDASDQEMQTYELLATVYSEQSEWGKVLEYSRPALDHYRETEKPERYLELLSLAADAHANLGQQSEGKRCCEEFIAAYDLFSLSKDVPYLSILLKLVDLCIATDSEVEAVSYCQQSLDVCNDLSNGEEKEQALQCYADLLGLMPQLEATKELRLKVLSGLGLLQQELELVDEAIKNFTTILQSASQVCSSEQTLLYMNNLMSCYLEKEDRNAAKPLLAEAWRMWNELQGSEKPFIKALLINCEAKIAQQEGDLDQAVRFFVEALVEMEAIFGRVHFYRVQILDNLAAVYQQRGEEGAANEKLLEACEILQQL